MRPRPQSSVSPTARLCRAIGTLPEEAVRALAEVAEREDTPLWAGSWREGQAGCLVANVLALSTPGTDRRTLDMQMLELFPELSSRDLNRLVVAWDEAAAEAGADTDAALRRLLRESLAAARSARDEPVPHEQTSTPASTGPAGPR